MSNALGKMTNENSKKPLLSIIVPAFNCEAYLKEGLDSILDQMTYDHELWKLADRDYYSVSDFADDYIRKRKMLVYSNCNKYYSNRIIKEAQIRFEEGISFGEDRLFNYRYLTEYDLAKTISEIKEK